MRNLLRAIALLSALAFVGPGALGAAPANCRLFHIGAQVVLYGTSDDPAVFVWDSRARMFEYAHAPFRRAQALLMHALLAPPGTRARVTYCAAFAPARRPKPSYDTVGIVIASGSLRGDAGWVRSTDIAVMH